MKRLIAIFFCLSVFFAGAASALADCSKFSLVIGNHDKSPRALSAHEHHSNAQHDHSQGTVIHCPTLDEFVLTSVFSLAKCDGVNRATYFMVAALSSQLSQHVSGWFIHGPPGLPHSRIMPPYLVLSVLRI